MCRGGIRLWETMDVTNAAPAPVNSPHDDASNSPDAPWGAVLFDLDGTLVDPAGGITQGIAQALESLGLPVPSQERLDLVVGPKLADGLVQILDVPADLVDAVVLNYRAWYGQFGIAMSRPYPGIASLLQALSEAGILVAVATQKPEPIAVTLLEHHGLADAFDVIRGSNPNELIKPGDPGYRAGKQEIIAAALNALDAGPHGKLSAVMVGDRYQDIEGAKANGLGCVGVGWGFAVQGELEEAGAQRIVASMAELARVLGLSEPVVRSLEITDDRDFIEAHDSNDSQKAKAVNGAV